MGKFKSTIRRAVKKPAKYILNKLFERYQPSISSRLVTEYCVGHGIEIGPGKAPYSDPKNTEFLDKHTENADGTPDPDIVADASNIPRPDSSFDFLVSSHCLEHCQNTLTVLHEWIRVLKPGGIMFLILPHGDRTFDRHRKKTTLQHHIDDYNNLTDEPDRTHIDEIQEGWSKNEDFEAGSEEYKKTWGVDVWDWDFRFKNDVIHFHVWSQNEMAKVLQYLDMELLYIVEKLPERHDSFLIIARKAE